MLSFLALALPASAADADGDGLTDLLDVCPLVPDPAQADGDGDGVGDACDVCAGPSDGLRLFDGSSMAIGGLTVDTAIGDVDLDGDLDLVLADEPGVTLIPNLGGGLFGRPIVMAALPLAEAVELVDVDLDGDVDLLSADGPGDVWLVENRAGVPRPPVRIARFGRPATLATGDLDGDGDPDVAIGVPQLEELHVLENLGNLAFGRRLFVGDADATSIVVADLDGDGDADLAANGNLGSETVLWFENRGGAGFGPRQVLASPGFAYSLDAADLDGDGDLDLVYGSDGVVVGHENAGGARFGSRRVLARLDAGWSGFGALGDLDADGDLDLVAGNEELVIWERNEGPWTFGEPETVSLAFVNATHLATADLDGDTALDIVRGGFEVRWSRSAGPCALLDTDADGLTDAEELLVSGTSPSLADTDADGLSDPVELAGPTDPRDADTDGDGALDGADTCPMAAPDDPDRDGICQDADNCPIANPGQADADGDGAGDVCDACFGVGPADGDGDGVCDDADGCVLVPDPLQADRDGDGTGDLCDVCPGDGDGSERFQAPTKIRTEPVGAPFPVDLDGDGDEDLLGSSRTLGLVVYTNLNGTLSPPQALGVVSDASSIAADLDGDGRPDVVAITEDGLGWARNTGAGLAPFAVVGPLPFPAAVALDVDADGDLDLAGAESQTGRIVWFENDGVGGFAAEQPVATEGAYVTALAAADLDGDGADDLVTGGGTGSRARVGWYPNLGGAFAARRNVPIEARNSVAGLVAADLDGDGDQDLVSAGTDLTLHRNAGGRFLPPEVLTGSIDNYTVAAADLDLDGDVDLAAAADGLGLDYGLWWLENRPDGFAWTAIEDVIQGDVAITDLDADGRPDLVVANDENGQFGGMFEAHHAPCATADTDADGLADWRELLEVGTSVTLADTDGDGLDDGDEVAAGADPFATDSDGDGVPDGRDVCPADALGDVDGDGVCASQDLCPEVADVVQRDGDGDGVGDTCDLCVGDDTTADPDGDGFCSDLDACDVLPGLHLADADRDGTGDACDACPGSPSSGLEWFVRGHELVPCWGNEFCSTDPRGLTAQDLDGDGDLDPILESTAGFGWIRNLAGDTFTHFPVGLGFVADGLRDAAWGDVDGDGAVDVAIAADAGSTVAVQFNDGAGDLTQGVVLEPPLEGPRGVAVGDLDGDGDLDVAAAFDLSDRVVWYENLGGRAFAPGALISAGVGRPTSVSAGDVDGDGDLDLAVARGDGGASWFTNLGVGRFGLEAVLALAPADPFRVVAGDVDLDGDAELVVASSIEGVVVLDLVAAPVVVVPGPVADLSAEDADGDGDLDLAALSDDGVGSAAVFLENHLGRFDPPEVRWWDGPLHLADLTGDGAADLMLGTYGGVSYLPAQACALADTDGDGLHDGEEVAAVGAHPARADTDRGGTTDELEYAAGTDPCDPADD